MKKTIRHCLYVSLLMLLPLWTACDKDIHENDRHGLAVGMEWLEGIEPTDITSPVNLWIYDAEGHEVEAHEFSSPQELASGLFSLPEGDYTLVGVCGLTEPYRYDYENGTRTADMLRVSLADPSASPAHAVGGVAGVRVTDTGVNLRSVIRVAPLLAELAVRIDARPKERRLPSRYAMPPPAFIRHGAAMTTATSYLPPKRQMRSCRKPLPTGGRSLPMPA